MYMTALSVASIHLMLTIPLRAQATKLVPEEELKNLPNTANYPRTRRYSPSGTLHYHLMSEWRVSLAHAIRAKHRVCWGLLQTRKDI